MYTSQRDTMSNLFTQQQHSFYSKEQTGRIGYFGQPAEQQQQKETEEPKAGKSEGGFEAKGLPLGRFNSISSNQNEAAGEQNLMNDDSQLTPAPSFGKISSDPIEDASPTLNEKSASKAALSDHTGGGKYRAYHIGTTSSISGSVGDKGWSEQKPQQIIYGRAQPNNGLGIELARKLDQP